MAASFEQLVDFLKGLDANKSAHSGGVSYQGHAVGVYRYLERSGYDSEIASAGLFHAIYGTTEAQQIRLPLERRSDIRALIGERAERLAYLNCAIDYETFDAAVDCGSPPFQMLNRFTGMSQEITVQDFEDLIKVQLFDRLEQVPRSKQFDFRRDSFRRMARQLGPAASKEFETVFPPDPHARQEYGALGRAWRVLRDDGPTVALERAVQAALWPMLHQLVDRRIDTLRDDIARQARSIAGLADVVGNVRAVASDVPASAEAAISIVMPIWNRAHLLPRAVDSLRNQSFESWELLIVDDGSTDRLEAALAAYRHDSRIRVFHQKRGRAAAARNVALAKAGAPLVGYLDSDCVLYPGALESVCNAFDQTPRAECLYLAQHWFDPGAGEGEVRADTFDRLGLMTGRCRVDLNAFFHRHEVYETCGGFDEELTRLQDLDLILRYTEHADPLFVPSLVGRYELGHFGITDREPLEPNRERIMAKWRPDGRRPPRVLYVVLNHPQLSEAYVRFEIDEMRRRGADVSVWSELPPVTPYEASEPVFSGSLTVAIDRVKPDVLHVHWSHFAEQKLNILLAAGVPLTVRGHGFDFAPERIERMLRRPEIRRIYLFPHHAAQASPSSKIAQVPAALPLNRFRPGEKNRRLVLRAGALLPTKNLELFVRAAKRLPDFEFVLCLARVHNFEYAAEFMKFVEDQGSPVDLRLDVPYEECFALFREAGIYLHTFAQTDPFGMPISIGQALASECYTLVRDVPGAKEYLGEAGGIYQDEDEAVRLIEATANWSDEQWAECRAKATLRADAFDDQTVLEPMFNDWRALANAKQDA